MKQFVYFDDESVNSLVAQIDNGLEEAYQQVHELGQSDASESNNSIKSQINGKLKIPAIVDLGSDITIEGSTASKEARNEIVREIHNIRLHDAIFTKFIQYLESKGALNTSRIKTGNFIHEVGPLQIVDLEYFSSLFEKNAFISFLLDSQNKEIDKAANDELDKLPRELRRQKEPEVKKQIALLKQQNNSQYDDIGKVLNAIKYVMPYKRMAVTSTGIILPLNEKSFRDNPNLLGIKYGGEFRYIGYITNIVVKNQTEDTQANIFSTLLNAINQMLFTIAPSASEELIILHPIAIYSQAELETI